MKRNDFLKTMTLSSFFPSILSSKQGKEQLKLADMTNKTGLRIKEIIITPIATVDPPLLNAAGLHAPYALRTVMEIITDDHISGISEIPGNKDIDVAWDIRSTSSISAHTFSILYSHSFYPKWSWSVGININQKGYIEKGVFKDAYEPTQQTYYNKKVRPYWGFLIGSQYQFYKKNSWACNLELLINPEAEKYGYNDAKKWGLSFTPSSMRRLG